MILGPAAGPRTGGAGQGLAPAASATSSARRQGGRYRVSESLRVMTRQSRARRAPVAGREHRPARHRAMRRSRANARSRDSDMRKARTCYRIAHAASAGATGADSSGVPARRSASSGVSLAGSERVVT